MAFIPTVLVPLPPSTLLTHIVNTQSGTASTTLIVCSTRDAFVQSLSRSLQQQPHGQDAARLEQLTVPTLHNLFTARHIHLAFCASVQALQAYLAAYGRAGTKQGSSSEEKGEDRLVLVNPLSLHAPTPSFSAQGLSRTFAAAVETAARVGARLQMVECLGAGATRLETARYDADDEEVDALMEGGDNRSQPEVEEEDPWEQHVSILNVSARRFASGSGDRAWAGRTIKVKRIAGRWFRFDELMGSAELRQA
jgi:hypothetical protein